MCAFMYGWMRVGLPCYWCMCFHDWAFEFYHIYTQRMKNCGGERVWFDYSIRPLYCHSHIPNTMTKHKTTHICSCVFRCDMEDGKSNHFFPHFLAVSRSVDWTFDWTIQRLGRRLFISTILYQSRWLCCYYIGTGTRLSSIRMCIGHRRVIVWYAIEHSERFIRCDILRHLLSTISFYLHLLLSLGICRIYLKRVLIGQNKKVQATIVDYRIAFFVKWEMT